MSKNRLRIDLREARAGASGDDMDRFERDAGVKIPPEYRRFLACQNGGSPVRRHFSFAKKPKQGSVLRSFFGVGCPLAFDLTFALEQYADRIPAKAFPIAIDEFDNIILISRKRGSTNQILFWDHEKELSGDEPIFVAATLKDFLEKLEDDKVEEYEIATITFEDGETCRELLPSRLCSVDRDVVIDVRDAKVGERIDDFGEVRTIVGIEFSRERMKT